MGLPAVVSLLCARKVASPSRRRHHTPPPSPTTMSRFTTALAACAVLDSVASAQKPSCSAARGAPYRQHDGNAAVTNGRTPVKRSAHRAPSEARPSHVVSAEQVGRGGLADTGAASRPPFKPPLGAAHVCWQRQATEERVAGAGGGSTRKYTLAGAKWRTVFPCPNRPPYQFWGSASVYYYPRSTI